MPQIRTRKVLSKFDAKLQALYLIQNLGRLDLTQFETLVYTLERLQTFEQSRAEEDETDVSAELTLVA